MEEALKAALTELNIDKDQAIVEVLEEPKTGFLGFLGSKEAIVKVTAKEEESPISTELEMEEKTEEEETVETGETITSKPVEKEEISSQFLEEILEKMHISARVEVEEQEEAVLMRIVDISDKDTGIVIGRRGETLDALQYLLNLVENKDRKEYRRIVIDCNDYRVRREQSLIRLAEKMAGKAKKFRRPVKLEPMNPYERRIIHSAIQNVDGVTTTSEGEEPYRRVVIRMKK